MTLEFSNKCELLVGKQFRSQLSTEKQIIDHVFKVILSESRLNKMNSDEILQTIKTSTVMLKNIKNEIAINYLYENLCFHFNPFIRREGVSLAQYHFPRREAIDALCILIHDPDDIVFIPAIQTSGDLRLVESLNHLFPLIGPGSHFFNKGINLPVGVGHAFVADAMEKIYGTDDTNKIYSLEKEFFETGTIRGISGIYNTPEEKSLPEIDQMIRVPSGKFKLGINKEEIYDHRLAYKSSTPMKEKFEGTFYIDKFPVTNRDYDEFVKDVGNNDELFRHPDQNPNKPHMRNTIHDKRFGPDHPVTGIDWYDAYAYSKWVGKDLPSEAQWEKAARGAKGNIYPWGNTFDEKYVNCFEDIHVDLTQWRKSLCKTSNIYPSITTYSVDAIPGNQSPYGVIGMSGNCWEYTKTNYYTREDMDPEFIGMDVSEFLQEESGYPVIKGGAWSSVPDMVSTWFRGKDLLTDRHFEIGFRCVKNIRSGII